MEVYLTNNKTLSYAVEVKLKGAVTTGGYTTGGNYEKTVTFPAGSWSSSVGTITSAADAWARVKCTSNIVMDWDYRVEGSGGNSVWYDSGDLSNMTYYLVWGSPSPLADMKNSRVLALTTIADSQTSASDVADVLGPDLTGSDRFSGANSIYGDDPIDVWDILDDGTDADCGSLSTLMKVSLELLGVGGAEVRFVYSRHESWSGLWSTNPYFSCMEKRVSGENDTRLGFLAPGWNNYEGCCHYDGKWWMGGAGSSESSDYDVLMHWTQPNTSANHHQAYHDIQSQAVDYPAGTP